MPQFAETELFGGAIVCALPSDFFNASKLRQIPDNQEVFLHQNKKDSITIDICQRVEGEGISTDEDAVTFHIEDIMDGDEPIFYTPIRRVSVPNIPTGSPGLSCYLSNKPTSKEKGYNGLLFLLIRLKEQATDIVISLNMPDMSVDENKTEADRLNGMRYRETALMLERIAATLKIKDWKLFGEENGAGEGKAAEEETGAEKAEAPAAKAEEEKKT